MKYATVLILLSLLSITAQGREVSCEAPVPWEANERSTCNVNEAFPKLDHEVVVTEDPRLHKLPNLYIPNMLSSIEDSETYVVTIEVANGGTTTATPNRLAILITETSSGGSVTTREKSLTGFVDLAPGASKVFQAKFRVPYGYASLITAIAIADPGSITSPGGDIWESNENDNSRTITFVTQQP